jgi:predicted Fe-Mo cluster-binding NifX family protein
MKIAITSADGTLDGMVDERFGRTKKIIIFDTETNTHETIDNTTNMNAAQGAGIQTAQNVVKTGARAVISGHLGPNAFRVVSGAGVEVFTVSGMTVRQALEAHKGGKLNKLAGADVEGHW